MDHEKEKEKEVYDFAYIESLPEGTHVELIDGHLYEMASPTSAHQEIVMELSASLYNFIKANNSSCKVYPSSTGVFLETDQTFLQPDIIVICDRDKISWRGCEGAPDLVIEIISSSTKHVDYGIKLFKYRSTGVREYWIVNPMTETIMVYFFDNEEENNQYKFTDDVPVHILKGLSINLGALLG